MGEAPMSPLGLVSNTEPESDHIRIRKTGQNDTCPKESSRNF